ncbi:MAG: hypothetical protein Q7T16_01120 [Candidatus Burarchaeum sp.]|nr:hypothetical protein [Candidatus Burarchaeum sp.]MDO8339237.1 hypothetical protein [Candidatus Burarchaeum sp.]
MAKLKTSPAQQIKLGSINDYCARLNDLAPHLAGHHKHNIRELRPALGGHYTTSITGMDEDIVINLTPIRPGSLEDAEERINALYNWLSKHATLRQFCVHLQVPASKDMAAAEPLVEKWPEDSKLGAQLLLKRVELLIKGRSDEPHAMGEFWELAGMNHYEKKDWSAEETCKAAIIFMVELVLKLRNPYGMISVSDFRDNGLGGLLDEKYDGNPYKALGAAGYKKLGKGMPVSEVPSAEKAQTTKAQEMRQSAPKAAKTGAGGGPAQPEKGLRPPENYTDKPGAKLRLWLMKHAGKRRDLSGLDLQGFNFSRLDLRNGDLTGAGLEDTEFLNAKVKNCKIPRKYADRLSAEQRSQATLVDDELPR